MDACRAEAAEGRFKGTCIRPLGPTPHLHFISGSRPILFKQNWVFLRCTRALRIRRHGARSRVSQSELHKRRFGFDLRHEWRAAPLLKEQRRGKLHRFQISSPAGRSGLCLPETPRHHNYIYLHILYEVNYCRLYLWLVIIVALAATRETGRRLGEHPYRPKATRARLPIYFKDTVPYDGDVKVVLAQGFPASVEELSAPQKRLPPSVHVDLIRPVELFAVLFGVGLDLQGVLGHQETQRHGRRRGNPVDEFSFHFFSF